MFKFWLDLSMLGLEAQQVVWLRSMKIAMGGADGEREARLMISEKIEAAGQAGLSLASGGTVTSVLKNYRRKVRANSKRLTR